MSRRQPIQSSRVDSRSKPRKTAADLDRDARNEAGNLKNILSSHPPWSREAEQCRQRCREIHLLLIFKHSLSPYSQSLDNLWHQTSYLNISSYRNIISNLEKSLANNNHNNNNFNARDNNSSRSGNNINNSGGGRENQNEIRKIITRFKQFLSTEETFYKSLISRIFNFYNLKSLKDLSSFLIQAKIHLSIDNNNNNNDHDEDYDIDEEDRNVNLSNTANGQDQKDKINLIYKALICLGDLERYKEQYHDQPKSRNNNNNNRRGNSSMITKGGEEKFYQARHYYEIARGIQPDDGSAFNQLAVISTYLSDPFSTTYYYFRASAIRNAFKGIDGIIYEYLGKATERWRTRRKEEKDKEDSALEKGDEVKKWKDDMIVLVGILYLKAGFSFIPTLQPNLLEQFSVLLKSRQLSTEVIVKTVVIVIGLHHHARNTAGIEQDQNLVKRSHEAEFKSLELLLGIAEVLMRIALEEIEDVKSTLNDESALAIDDDNDSLNNENEDDNMNMMKESKLPEYISAVLRRILPSLRILSKWIKLDLDYLSRFSNNDNNPSTIIKSFWKTYKKLIDNLGYVFPISQLPSLPEPLEEDLDMKGFSPLQRGLTTEGGRGGISSSTLSNEGNNHSVEGAEVHPNEEQLMRLADIQVDAKLIMQSGVGAVLLGQQPVPLAPTAFEVPRERESDMASVSTETEDDPVNLAMRATLASESSVDGDEDNDEVIVWNKSPPLAVQNTATIPVPTPTTKKPTAYDLLQNLMLESTPTPPVQTSNLPHIPPKTSSPSMNVTNTPPHIHNNVTSAGTPGSGGLLFGSSGNNANQGNINSIWTMTREESEKGQKRSSTTGMGQPNIAAIWGNNTVNVNPAKEVSSATPSAATSIPSYSYQHTLQPSQAIHTPGSNTASPAQQYPQYVHNSIQSQYPYYASPQNNQSASASAQHNVQPAQTQNIAFKPFSGGTSNNTWGMSNIPLPLPLPLSQQPQQQQQQTLSPTYPYDQTQSRLQYQGQGHNETQTQGQQLPYYLQPAYYASKSYGTTNWGGNNGNNSTT
ncbi:uncharacterized protein L201_000557 [Kwoniella dendrophila CBS 6074]|uniref:DNA/RNA-binding domain-containing protein n=1 Tax=Kwoniella dendrophila CBS 6074 TaxID=1295534 RepID=A0AAX4JJY0_9TREE